MATPNRRQWEHNGYPLNLVDPRRLVRFGIDGTCLWYLCEIATRTEYYKLLLAGNE